MSAKILDYTGIAERLTSHRLIGAGESTHSTHEFFETKAELFKVLVSKHGFNVIFFESVDDHCARLNTYIQTGRGNLKSLVNKLSYFYRTKEVFSLFVWLRENYRRYPVTVMGIDERKHVDDYASNYNLDKMNLRDKRMALVVKRYLEDHHKAKGMVWAHDSHVTAYVNAPLRLDKVQPMGRHLRRWYKKDYYNIAQLFGSGQFRAAAMGPNVSGGSNLETFTVGNTPVDFWEHRLIERVNQPTFLEGPTFGGLAKPHEIHKKRSIGWGVERSAINNAFEWIDLYHAYNALIFFPHINASEPL